MFDYISGYCDLVKLIAKIKHYKVKHPLEASHPGSDEDK